MMHGNGTIPALPLNRKRRKKWRTKHITSRIITQRDAIFALAAVCTVIPLCIQRKAKYLIM